MDPIFAKTLVSAILVVSIGVFSLLAVRQAVGHILGDLRRARDAGSDRPTTERGRLGARNASSSGVAPER